MADEKKAVSPAYVAYATFKSTVKGLAHNGKIPAQIDPSLLSGMSGSSRTQFLSAMRFFELIDEKGTPSAVLKQMATGDENGWNAAMKQLVLNRYPEQVKHLESGTAKMLRDSFGEIGGIVKPAVRFLLAACKDTGIPVSPHILKDKSSVSPSPRKRRTPPKPLDENNGTGGETPPPPPQPQADAFRMALLNKFPAFDTSWKPEQQQAWFDAYKRLLEMGEAEQAK